MKDGKLTEKLVKFGIMAIGTLGSVFLASCIKSKDPDVIECGAGDIEVTDAPAEEVPAEEVTGGEEG